MEEFVFHRAIKLNYKEGTRLEVTYEDGFVKSYDMSDVFEEIPALKALEDRALFESGKLNFYGIIWNEVVDFSAEEIYRNGRTVRKVKPIQNLDIGDVVGYERACADMSQVQLAELTGIDQSDISKIERGIANPSVSTLKKIAKALNKKLVVSFEDIEEEKN